jgi:proteasome assembly chaperone (PAC2) family protein
VSSLFRLLERPDLESPVLVVVLDGWIDAGLGAQQARACIEEQIDPVLVADFDTDTLLDHRARRPTMQLVDGVHAGLEWPAIELKAATDGAGNEFLFLVGAEPDHQWRAFSEAVGDLAMEFGVRLVAGLGAYPLPVPHTRPPALASTATSRELAELVGRVGGTVAVPAGVQAAIESRCGEIGLPAVGLWAQVPHYVAAMPYPAAAIALIEGLRRVAGLELEPRGLDELTKAARARIDELVAQNEEHVQMVAQLEAQADAEADGLGAAGSLGPLPSGDELAAELERYLREQGPGA